MPLVIPRSYAPVASIIIAVSEKTDRLFSCLRSIQCAGPKDLPFETIVVLNAPLPNEESLLRTGVDGIEILVSPFNLGLAGASNYGREKARGDYIVILHDDTEVQPGWLEALVATADDHPEAGAVGSKVLNFDGSLQSAGLILWSDAHLSTMWAAEPPPHETFSSLRAVDLCVSASLLVRASAWDLVDGFDEQFFPAYFIDVDLCTALRNNGFLVLFEPASIVFHRAGSSSDEIFRRYMLGANRALFAQKWSAALVHQEPRDEADMENGKRRAQERVRRRSGPAYRQSPIERRDQDENARLRRLISAHERILSGFQQYCTELFATERADQYNVYDGLLPVETGSKLSFHWPGNNLKYAVSGGFYEPEGWGVWLRSVFEMFIPLAKVGLVSGERHLRLEICLQSFICATRVKSPFRVSVGGLTILDLEETSPGEYVYHAEIPIETHASHRFLALQIESFDLQTPESFGLSGDDRALGIGLVWLRILGADSPPLSPQFSASSSASKDR